MTITLKNLILAVVGLAVIIGLSVLLVTDNKSPDNSKTISSAILAAIETRFDFGTISMQKGNVSHKFELKNEGSEAVVINKVYTSCMCTTASLIDGTGKRLGIFGMPGHGGGSGNTNVNLAAGKSLTVEAIFNPAAHGPSGVGFIERSVYLETNSSETPVIELGFTAEVTK